MPFIKPIIYILTLCISPSVVQSQNVQLRFYSGNDIFPSCQSNSSFITGYVTGVIDYAGIASSITDRSSIRVCVPLDATNGQAKDVFCKFLADNPEKRHIDASALVFNAMQDAFPCTN